MRQVLWILASVAISVLTLLLARQFLLALPADHFCRTGKPSVSKARRIADRIVGVLLIGLGIVLAVPGIPGQGLLLVLVGLILLDLPILRRLELRVLRVSAVSKAVNRMRTKAGKAPLDLPIDSSTR